MPLKHCPRCGSTKDLEDFPNDASKYRRDGKYPYCKECNVDLVAEYKLKKRLQKRAKEAQDGR